MGRLPSIPYKVKLLDSRNELSQKFVDQLFPMVSNTLGFAAPKIKSRVIVLVDRAIENSDTYRSMVGGELQGAFGFVDGQVFADMVKDYVVQSIQVYVRGLKKTTYTIKGSIFVGLVNSNFNDALNHPLASYKSNGGNVDWLEWLLLAGTQIVVADHHIVYSSARSVTTFSRSGQALMYPHGTFAIPSKYAGTKNDNWITRAILPLEQQICDIIEEEFERAI